jgi:glyceraldehyde 3-phosphate dehydrogenase
MNLYQLMLLVILALRYLIANATIIGPDKKSIVLYVWYDNEYGYTRQVIRFSKHIAEVRRATYY